MTKQEIKKELEAGAKAVKDFNGFCGIVKGGAWVSDINRRQFGRLVANTKLKVDYPVGSVFVCEVTK